RRGALPTTPGCRGRCGGCSPVGCRSARGRRPPSHRPVPGRSSWSPVQRRGSGRASLSPLLLGRPQGFDDSPLLDTSSLLLGSTLVFGLPRRPAIRPADGAVSWLGSVALARWWAKAREKEMSTSHESRTSKDFV